MRSRFRSFVLSALLLSVPFTAQAQPVTRPFDGGATCSTSGHGFDPNQYCVFQTPGNGIAETFMVPASTVASLGVAVNYYSSLLAFTQYAFAATINGTAIGTLVLDAPAGDPVHGTRYAASAFFTFAPISQIGGGFYTVLFTQLSPLVVGGDGAVGFDIDDSVGDPATAVTFNADATTTPEPASWLLLASGIVGLGIVRRRASRPA